MFQNASGFVAYCETFTLTWAGIVSLLLQSSCLGLLLAVRSAVCRILKGPTPSTTGLFTSKAPVKRRSGSVRRASLIPGLQSAVPNSQKEINNGVPEKQLPESATLFERAAEAVKADIERAKVQSPLGGGSGGEGSSSASDDGAHGSSDGPDGLRRPRPQST